MLLAAFSFLPASLQTQVVARVQQDLAAHGGATWALSAPECRQLLTGLNPVLNWCLVQDEITLSENEWQRMLHHARLAPEMAAKLLT